MDQEKLAELQMLEQQMQSLSQNLTTIENNIADVNSIVNSIDEFSKLKKGDKVLVSLSNGIFAHATLDNSQELKVNVGRNTVVSKSIEEVKSMMSAQQKELEGYRSESEEYYSQIAEKLELLHKELISEGKTKAQ